MHKKYAKNREKTSNIVHLSVNTIFRGEKIEDFERENKINFSQRICFQLRFQLSKNKTKSY